MSDKAKAKLGDTVLVENEKGRLVERRVVAIASYAGEGGGLGEKFFYQLDEKLHWLGSRWVVDYRVKAVIHNSGRSA